MDVLKLIGREEELSRLERFVNDEALNSWCLIAAVAGAGKSRLCCAFATRMNRLSWDVRYLDHDVEMGLEKLKVRACNDMLVVVDYGIARNLSTQSINVDKTSVYFYGVLKDGMGGDCGKVCVHQLL